MDHAVTQKGDYHLLIDNYTRYANNLQRLREFSFFFFVNLPNSILRSVAEIQIIATRTYASQTALPKRNVASVRKPWEQHALSMSAAENGDTAESQRTFAQQDVTAVVISQAELVIPRAMFGNSSLGMYPYFLLLVDTDDMQLLRRLVFD